MSDALTKSASDKELNRREAEKIGDIKEKKHVLKQSSAQSAQDFLWAHFVAPLDIEEDLSLEEDSRIKHGNNTYESSDSQRNSAKRSSSTSPVSNEFARLTTTTRRSYTRGGGRRSGRRSSSSEGPTPSSANRLSTTSGSGSKVKPNRPSKLGRQDSGIKMKRRSPSPIPTPPPLPAIEVTIRTIDGNYVKIGLRPHKDHDAITKYVEPFDHLAKIEPPEQIKNLKLRDVGPESAYGPYEKEDIYRILKEKFPWFTLLDYDSQENVMDIIKPRSYGRNQYIYRQGDDPDGMYFIEEGVVDLIYDKVDGSTSDNLNEAKVSLLVASLGPEEFFGETECYHSQSQITPISPICRYTNALVGSESVRVLFLPLSAVIKYLIPNPKIMQGFAQHLELYKDQLLQFGVKDLGELLPKKSEKAAGQTKATAAEYLWGHFYEEIGAAEGKERTKPQIPRPVDRGGEFLAHLFKLWMENRCCDSVIKMNYHRFPVHSLILKLFCKNYDTLVNQDDPKTLILTNLPPKAILESLYYLYTARIILTTSNVQNVLKCALTLGIPSLIEMCKHFAEVYLEPEDVLKVSQSFQDIKSLSLEARMARLLTQKFEVLASKEEFKSLSAELILKYLTHSELKVESEYNVLKALVDWINADPGSRLPLAPKLINQCVRFNSIPPSDILKVTLPNPHIFEGQECKALVLNAITYHALHPGVLDSVSLTSRIRSSGQLSSSHSQEGATGSSRSTSGTKMSVSFARKKSSVMNLPNDGKIPKSLSRTSVLTSDSDREVKDKDGASAENLDLPALTGESAMASNEGFKRPRKSIKLVEVKDKDLSKSKEQVRSLAEIEQIDKRLNRKHAENLDAIQKTEKEAKEVLKTVKAEDKKVKLSLTKQTASKTESDRDVPINERMSRLKKVDKSSLDDKKK